MEKVIRVLEKQPISVGLLRDKLPGYCKVIMYDDLPTKGTLEAVFGRRVRCLVVMYLMRGNREAIGHYSTVLRLGKNSYEYFSSYGYSPEQEIHKTHSGGR